MALEALIRNGSREGGKLEPIGMEEALRTAAMWLSASVHQGGGDLALCVGADADFQLACDWAEKAGIDKIFADRAVSAANAPQPRAKNKETSLILAFGSGLGMGAKDTQQRLARMRQAGAKIISINPVKTGLSTLADQWLAIRPGGDQALLEVLTGKKPCDYNQLSNTDISVLVMERLLREIEAHKGKITIVAGRGIYSHTNGTQLARLLKSLKADILPAVDNNQLADNLANVLNEDCEAVLCLKSHLPWQSQSRQALEDFEGRIICLSQKPAGFETCADLVFCGSGEDNLLALGARLGLKGFSDVEGNSPFNNAFAEYQPMGAKFKPAKLKTEKPESLADDPVFPFHAISQKAPKSANRSLVYMNTNKAKFLGLAAKDIVWIKSATDKQQAMLVLMDDMNENTLWSWGGNLFAPLMPNETPLHDATTGQPAWFDLKVAIEKIA